MRLRYLPLAESEFNSNVILERVICFRMTAAKKQLHSKRSAKLFARNLNKIFV
jgi:hypothetical protein